MRRLALIVTSAALTVAAGALAGCAPDPAPTPTPTGFTSEAEAFAAAEETYRAYVAATNARRQDPASSPAPDSYLREDALEAQIAAERQLDELDVRVQGNTKVVDITPVEFSQQAGVIVIEACVDSSETRVIGAGGEDVTPSDREFPTSIRVEVKQAHQLFIVSTKTARTGSC